MYSLEAISLSKSFTIKKSLLGKGTQKKAVDGIQFAIHPGESVAFLGPNGAGKSTTIKMLCGILKPDSGQALIQGHVAGHRLANSQLGLVFGTRSQLWPHMKIKESLELIAGMYGIWGAEFKKRCDHLSGLFEATKLMEQRSRTLSLGERMRCEMLAALIHKPKILLADEPTIGLDVIVRAELRKLLREWQETEKTVLLLTSHDLADVEALCNRAILVNHGRKVFDGPLSEVAGDFGHFRRVNLKWGEHILLGADKPKWDGVVFAEENEKGMQVEIDTRVISLSAAMAKLFGEWGSKIADFQVSEIPLEEILANKYHEVANEL